MLFANAPRMFVIKGRRETLIVSGIAVASLLALGLGLNARVKPSPAVDQAWVGQLAVTAPSASLPPQPMSSASLVVPKSQLTLPPLPAKPAVRTKSVCDSADKYCVVQRPASALPVVEQRRQVASIALDAPSHLLPPGLIPEPRSKPAAQPTAPVKNGLLVSLNPLNHLPDMTVVGRPFSAAGTMVSNWIKRF